MATSRAHRTMLKLLVLTCLRISEVTQANVGARDVPHQRPQWLGDDGNSRCVEPGDSPSYFWKALKSHHWTG